MNAHPNGNCFGVVLLAAGASRRMGTCKLLLPWGKQSILAHLLHQWRMVGAAQIAPVIDPANKPLRTALEKANFSAEDWIENPKPEMFSSVQEASRWAGWRPDLTHWILTLGDQPHLQVVTLCMLLEASRQNPKSICQPVFNGRTAHPIVLPGAIFWELAQSNEPDLRAFIRKREALRVRVAVEDAGVSADLDTPDDYERWKPAEGLNRRDAEAQR